LNRRHPDPQSGALTAELYPPQLARLKGFEPLTHGLEGRCSVRLSYRRITVGAACRIALGIASPLTISDITITPKSCQLQIDGSSEISAGLSNIGSIRKNKAYRQGRAVLSHRLIGTDQALPLNCTHQPCCNTAVAPGENPPEAVLFNVGASALGA
jgi:hypothetical protein